jgi:hypothetical protein
MIVKNVWQNWRICCPPVNWFQSDGDTPTLSVVDVLRCELVVIVAPDPVVPSTVAVRTNVVWDALAVVVDVCAFCTVDDAFCDVFDSKVSVCSVGDA